MPAEALRKAITIAAAHIPPFLFLTTHINGFFSHNRKDLCFFHPRLSAHSSKSKFHRTRARISCISLFARFRPMQLRGPIENGCSTPRLSL